MLLHLQIKNIAIIESLSVSFKKGLNVLTGETGAGKSIIIDAIALIMGERGSAGLIRSGAEEASVEALFDIKGNGRLMSLLSESGFASGDELVVRRSVTRSGKGRVFINGSLATQAQLSEITTNLVNVYGQHDSQSLLKTDNHLIILDSCAGLSKTRKEHETLHSEYLAAAAELERIRSDERETVRRCDLLKFQTDEIDSIKPLPNEDELLLERIRLLAHTEKLKDTTFRAYETIYGRDGSILAMLDRTASELESCAAIDHSITPLASSIRDAAVQLEDSALSLRAYSSKIESDQGELAKSEERLDQLNRLKRKYGSTLEEVITYRNSAQEELIKLTNREEEKKELEDELAGLAEKRRTVALKLSEHRKKATAHFSKTLENELHQLAMKDASIEVSVDELQEPRSTGMDRVDILFSPNRGESARPLAKIASGGELSRFMLALKQVLPEADVPTLVFDEVDAGIGGAVSATVAEKLLKVSRSQQVLCITHLPQVAARADHHFRVSKSVCNDRTITSIDELDHEAHVTEVARMLAGSRITESALRHARELIG